MWAKLRTVAASNNRDYAPQSLCYCFFAPHTHIVVVLRAHPVRGELRIEGNATERLQQYLYCCIRYVCSENGNHYVCESVWKVSGIAIGGLRVGGPEARLKKGPLMITSSYSANCDKTAWSSLRRGYADHPRIRSWDCGMTNTTENAKEYSSYTTLKTLKIVKAKLATRKR